MQNWYGILGLHYYMLECRYFTPIHDADIQAYKLYLYLESDKLTYKAKDNSGKIIIVKIEPHELGSHYAAIKTLLQSPDKKNSRQSKLKRFKPSPLNAASLGRRTK